MKQPNCAGRSAAPVAGINALSCVDAGNGTSPG